MHRISIINASKKKSVARHVLDRRFVGQTKSRCLLSGPACSTDNSNCKLSTKTAHLIPRERNYIDYLIPDCLLAIDCGLKECKQWDKSMDHSINVSKNRLGGNQQQKKYKLLWWTFKNLSIDKLRIFLGPFPSVVLIHWQCMQPIPTSIVVP